MTRGLASCSLQHIGTTLRLLLLGVVLLWGCAPPPDELQLNAVRPRCRSSAPHLDRGFVRVCDGRFVLDGRPFAIKGVNAYYLQEETARELRFGEDTPTLDEVLGELATLGATVVRTWAFNDQPGKDSAIQTCAGRYGEAGLAGLDHVIAGAERHGLRLILTLVNYWPEYGGVDQYLRWSRLPTGELTDRGAFFTDERPRQHFRQHLTFLMNRVNTVTGRLYRDEPAVMAWELMNEGRGVGASPWLVAKWVEEMAGHLRQQGVRQLISTGESGYDELEEQEGADLDFIREHLGRWAMDGSLGTRLSLNTQLVDFASAHCYPEHWGVDRDRSQEICGAWLRLHARTAEQLGRPLICGEIGLTHQGYQPSAYFDMQERRGVYRAWLQLAEQGQVAGILPWLFIPDERPAHWDCCSFGWQNGTPLDDDGNQYMDLLLEHWARM